MILPSHLQDKNVWTFVGPMGPGLPNFLNNYPILAVDGGAEHSQNITLWVGDADSTTKEIHSPYKFKHPTEKNQSDLSLAYDLFVKDLSYEFHLWGFMGGRLDHELFNLGESTHFLKNKSQSVISFYDCDGLMKLKIFSKGEWIFSHIGLFSLGVIKNNSLSLTGKCKYPIENSLNLGTLKSTGLSNVGEGPMKLVCDGPVFVYFLERTNEA